MTSEFDTSDEQYDELLVKLTAAIDEAVNSMAREGQYVVNKWALVVDSTRMDSGMRVLDTLFERDESAWDIKGLLGAALDNVDEYALWEEDE